MWASQSHGLRLRRYKWPTGIIWNNFRAFVFSLCPMTNVSFPLPSLQFFHRNSSIFNLQFFNFHIFALLDPLFLSFVMPGRLKMAPNEKQGDTRTESELLPIKAYSNTGGSKGDSSKVFYGNSSCSSSGQIKN